MSTVEVAKDLDVLRQALGEGKLDYFGASYGTLIGATYANMFPTHVGRMVLDGAVDPALSNAELAMQQAGGFETALRAYVADCTKHSKCVLGNDVETGLARIRRLLADIEQRPLPTDSSRDLEIGNAYIGIWLPLYVKDYWPSLTRALDEAITKGRGTQLLELADQYVGRGPSSYNDNSMEVLYAVNCLDHSDSIPTKQVPKYFAEFEKVSPTFGKAFAFSLSTCAEWPVQSGQVTKAMAAAGAPPIVVVGTTRDPATPYQWAVNLADELDSGVLISRDGDGHTGYNSNNSCVDDAINAYLVDGEVPKDGLKCAEE
jgi:pimeloyl-ACP methyl ester carboxylesterase